MKQAGSDGREIPVFADRNPSGFDDQPAAHFERSLEKQPSDGDRRPRPSPNDYVFSIIFCFSGQVSVSQDRVP
jgi:hypothetical protein